MNTFTLNRSQIRPCQKSLIEYWKDKRVLVTGAAGSIGKRICQALDGLARLTCVDFNEYGIFWLQQHLKEGTFLLEDIQNLPLSLIKNQDIVVHAAAYKHVGLLQAFPTQAIRNNVAITAYLSGLCWQANKKFCLISTDKAVSPACIMGYTKWMAEKIVDSWRQIGLQSTVIRFANVFGSSGSLIDLWDNREEDIIKVTSRGMWRWFITGEEAASYILRAIELSDNKDYLWAIKPDEETNIYDLAIRYAKENDCEIQETQPGSGEKLREWFCSEGQHLEKKDGFLYVVKDLFSFQSKISNSENL